MERLLKWNFNRKFGLEYEFQNDRYSLSRMSDVVEDVTGQCAEIRSYETTYDNYNLWVCKTDSSCGTELVSPILSGPSKLKTAAEILPQLEESGFTISESCGQHVHVEIADFTEEQKGIIASYWMKIERFIINGTPAHRRTNCYCAPLSQKHTYVEANRGYDPVYVLRNMAGGRDAINFGNIHSNRKTIEFRFGDMTFDPEVIKNRVRFLIWFVEMCKVLPAPSNLNWMTPKQVLRTFNLWEDPKSAIKYTYSPAIQSMRKWLLSRLVEFAPNAFKKDADKCKIMLEEIENTKVYNQLEEECA